MSKLKALNNATLPGRKVESTAQSRAARQAKERIMPKKPKPGPKVDEPKKPYEATSAEAEAIDAYLAARKGRSCPG